MSSTQHQPQQSYQQDIRDIIIHKIGWPFCDFTTNYAAAITRIKKARKQMQIDHQLWLIIYFGKVYLRTDEIEFNDPLNNFKDFGRINNCLQYKDRHNKFRDLCLTDIYNQQKDNKCEHYKFICLNQDNDIIRINIHKQGRIISQISQPIICTDISTGGSINLKQINFEYGTLSNDSQYLVMVSEKQWFLINLINNIYLQNTNIIQSIQSVNMTKDNSFLIFQGKLQILILNMISKGQQIIQLEMMIKDISISYSNSSLNNNVRQAFQITITTDDSTILLYQQTEQLIINGGSTNCQSHQYFKQVSY